MGKSIASYVRIRHTGEDDEAIWIGIEGRTTRRHVLQQHQIAKKDRNCEKVLSQNAIIPNDDRRFL